MEIAPQHRQFTLMCQCVMRLW